MQKSSKSNSSGTEWKTVGVPLSGGVDLRSGQYLRDPSKMRRLVNAQFSERKELIKRDGHLGDYLASYASSYPPPLPAGVTDLEWLPGVGMFSESARPYDIQLRHKSGMGLATRDDQLIAWTGDRILVKSLGGKWTGRGLWFGSEQERGIPAMFCSANQSRLTVPTQTVSFSSVAVGNSLRCFAYSDGVNTYARFSSLSGDSIVHTHTLPAGVERLKVVAVFDGFLVIYATPGDTTVYARYFSELSPSTPFAAFAVGLYSSVGGWDVAKRSDTLCVLASLDTGVISLTYFDRDGVVEDLIESTTPIATTSTPTDKVAIAVSPVTGNLGIFWGTATVTYGNIYDQLGVAITAEATFTSDTGPITATYIPYGRDGEEGFVVFGGLAGTLSSAIISEQITLGGQQLGGCIIPNTQVAGEAFSYGNYPMVIVRAGDEFASYADRQYSTDAVVAVTDGSFIGKYTVVAAYSRGAAAPIGVDYPAYTVDFLPGQDSLVRTRWSTSTGRFISFSQGGAVYESAIDEVQLDFNPELVSASAGRSTYFAGGIVQQWDGATLTEAGFIMPPMYIDSAAVSVGTGSLPAGTVRYRVYAVKRNRWGEISRSPAFTSEAIVVAANDEVTLKIASMPLTNDPTVYFEVYRSSVSGNDYRLVSGQVPADAVFNDPLSESVEITDDMAEADRVLMPLDPHNPIPGQPVELEESAPPGCTIIANAFDRLWFAGGEIPLGSVCMSKYFEVNESVAWNDLGVLYYQPDRGVGAITAIAPVENAVVIARADALFALVGDGPDNLGNGSWQPARRIPCDLGAISQNTVAQCPYGIVYWSAEGPRLLGTNFQVLPIGDEIATEARLEPAHSAVQVPRVTQVRFYRRNGSAVVWDYVAGEWSTYTNVKCRQAVFWPSSAGAVLIKEEGEVWQEEPDHYLDAGIPYEQIVRTADIHLEALIQGSSRVRRWSIIGRILGDMEMCHTVYYDGSPKPLDKYNWDVSDSIQTDVNLSDDTTFGESGTFWDTDTSRQANDGVFRVNKRFDRQVCSTVSIEFSDNFAPNGGFVISEMALEVGLKPGLRRLPNATFTRKY